MSQSLIARRSRSPVAVVLRTFVTLITLGALCGLPVHTAQAARQAEYLDRGVVAIPSGTGIYIGWRMLGDDAANIGFNVYRNGVKITASPITNSTNYFDASGTSVAAYTVKAIVNGIEVAANPAKATWTNPYFLVNLQKPADGLTPANEAYSYSPNDLSVGDLDGDGDYEIIVKWDPSNSKDNSQKGYTGNVYIDAYKLNGTQLWRIDLGKNIRAGAHYTQFMVYDLDGDGKAEIALKTSDGTKDGTGLVIGNSTADHRNSSGYILSGPEFLTLFNGETGAAMATTNYLPARGTVSSWGDDYGNRVDRFLGGIAYLDGTRPSLIMSRGYYTRAVVAAWDWRDGKLSSRWIFDSNTSGNSAAAGQGAHSMSIGDTDGDGKDEIIYGAAAIDDDGKLLFSTKLGHGDALHLSDLDPSRPGLEVFMVHETPSSYGDKGIEMHDAKTGAILWSVKDASGDIGRGVTMDIDPRYPGNESWASTGGIHSAKGELISASRPATINFRVWWDADLLGEELNDEIINKWNYTTSKSDRLLTGYNFGAASNNTTKATPGLSADIMGDWREEVIWRNDNNTQLMIFSTTAVTTYKLRTLMHDIQYREAIAWQNVGYNQPPHPSFFLGDGMTTPPAPSLYFVGKNPNALPVASSSSKSSSSTPSSSVAASSSKASASSASLASSSKASSASSVLASSVQSSAMQSSSSAVQSSSAPSSAVKSSSVSSSSLQSSSLLSSSMPSSSVQASSVLSSSIASSSIASSSRQSSAASSTQASLVSSIATSSLSSSQSNVVMSSQASVISSTATSAVSSMMSSALSSSKSSAMSSSQASSVSSSKSSALSSSQFSAVSSSQASSVSSSKSSALSSAMTSASPASASASSAPVAPSSAASSSQASAIIVASSAASSGQGGPIIGVSSAASSSEVGAATSSSTASSNQTSAIGVESSVASSNLASSSLASSAAVQSSAARSSQASAAQSSTSNSTAAATTPRSGGGASNEFMLLLLAALSISAYRQRTKV